jgi:hypothetical protein
VNAKLAAVAGVAAVLLPFVGADELACPPLLLLPEPELAVGAGTNAMFT